MSGAQAKAAVIAGCVGVIAEVSGLAGTSCGPARWVSGNRGGSAAFEFGGLCAGGRGSSQKETRAGLGDGSHKQDRALRRTHPVASRLTHAYH